MVKVCPFVCFCMTAAFLAGAQPHRLGAQTTPRARLWLTAEDYVAREGNNVHHDGFFLSDTSIGSPPPGPAAPPLGPSALKPLGGDVFPPLFCKTPLAAPLSQVKAYVASDGRLQVLLPSPELRGMGARPQGPSLHVLLDGHGPWKELTQELDLAAPPKVITRFVWPGATMKQTCFAAAPESRGFYVDVELHNTSDKAARFRVTSIAGGMADPYVLEVEREGDFKRLASAEANHVGPRLPARMEHEVELTPGAAARLALQLKSRLAPPAAGQDDTPLRAARRAWEERLAPAARLRLPDARLQLAHEACLRQMLMLIEQRGAQARILKGLEHYYGSNPYDTFQVSRALDSLGMKAEAEQILRWQLSRLRPCGIFEMWEQEQPHPTNVDQWIVQGLAAQGLWQHYLLWNAEAWLAEIAPALVRAAGATLHARQPRAARQGNVELAGLLPPCGGDGGLPHGYHWSQNAAPLAGVHIAAAAARQLKLPEADALARGAADFQRAYDETRQRSVAAHGGKMLPAFPGATGPEATRAYWGAVMSVTAFDAIPAHDPAAVATLRFLQGQKDPGGLHRNLGYSAGVWPYLSAEVALWHARLGEFDEAWKILQAIVAHASPTVCWHEEQERNPARGHGDPADVWTAAEVVYLTRKLMVWESGDDLFLCPGMPAEWTAKPNRIAAENVPTRWGRCSYAIRLNGNRAAADIQLTGPQRPARIHVCLPPSLGTAWREVNVGGARVVKRTDRGVVLGDAEERVTVEAF